MSILSTVLMSLSILTGNEPSSKPSNQSKLIDEVRKCIAYPMTIESKNDRELVLVSFSLEPCGTIKVHEVNYSNAEFRDYVIEELENLKLKGDFPHDERCHVRFSFVKE
jgi:hypothetical protein